MSAGNPKIKFISFSSYFPDTNFLLLLFHLLFLPSSPSSSVSSFFFFFKNPNPWVLFINSEVTFRKFRSENFLHESCSSARRLKPVKFWEFSEFFWCLKTGLQLLYSSMAGEFLQIRFLHLFLISTTLVTVLASWNLLEIVLFTTYAKFENHPTIVVFSALIFLKYGYGLMLTPLMHACFLEAWVPLYFSKFVNQVLNSVVELVI